MNWTTDILGDYFQQTTIELADDYEGKAIATLIRRLTMSSSQIAVLYIHGFNDYFFQKEMAEKFNDCGCNFYALDLRKYGRSYLPHQKFNDTRNLKSYYEEVNKSLGIIRSEGNGKTMLMGHSTGGLIATLYVKDNTSNGLFDGLILNSPFFDFNMSSKFLEKMIPFATSVGNIFPQIKIAGTLSKEYGESLHKSYDGEWDYNLDWKPNTPPPISLGWLKAIRNGHKALRQDFEVKEPVLVLHSWRTITDKFDNVQMHQMDAVLSVADIVETAHRMKGNVQVTAIRGGMHDLILSKKEVREQVYGVMMEWMKKNAT